MSEAATNNGDDEIVTVNFKLTRSFLNEIEVFGIPYAMPSNTPRSTAMNSSHSFKRRRISVSNGR